MSRRRYVKKKRIKTSKLAILIIMLFLVSLLASIFLIIAASPWMD